MFRTRFPVSSSVAAAASISVPTAPPPSSSSPSSHSSSSASARGMRSGEGAGSGTGGGGVGSPAVAPRALSLDAPRPRVRGWRVAEVCMCILCPQAEWASLSNACVLMIKRVHSPRDRWSGHVALPGGHARHNEEPGATALRETYEETGVDLRQLGARLVGYLPGVSVKEQRLFVRPVVFELVQPVNMPPPAFLVDAGEVADAWWVPLNELCQPTSAPYRAYFMHRFPVRMPGLRLPRANWHLWGMTLHFVQSLLARRFAIDPERACGQQNAFHPLGVLADALTALRARARL